MDARPICLLLAAVVALTGCGDRRSDAGVGDVDETSRHPAYAGSGVCAACHAEQYRLWRGSHHELAMEPATDEYVLGDFDGAKFVQHGVRTTFYQRAGEFFVRTDGPDGKLREYRVRYTFGVSPLQQYIVELDNGRLQALGIAWDSRAADEGGQRWFHVYGDEPIGHDDVLHWTALSQNWDSMCAECHSTGIEKTFDLDTGSFSTRWAEINVACEACHGPAAAHVAWAEAGRPTGNNSLVVHFDERVDVAWAVNKATGNSTRSPARTTAIEIDACAPCHSRRSRIAAAPMPGEAFLDAYVPALPQPPLYHADGQIRDEVYVWGSFLQSRMYQQGVTCSDCHEPHSLRLRAAGSQVCLQCHLGERFATPDHQLLPVDSQRIVCVECHMPATTYMQVDARRDHSFRVPRPDLSVAYGVPNACDGCHAGRGAEWSVTALRALKRAPVATGHWAEHLLAARQAGPRARGELFAVANSTLAPGIIRATAIAELLLDADPGTIALAGEWADSADPLIRWAVARSLQQSHPAAVTRIGPKLLIDPVRGVRLAAASALAPLSLELLPQEVVADLQAGIEEYVQAQLVSAERAEAHVNIGNIRLSQRRSGQAEAAYRTALRLNPRFVPGYVNLADLYRLMRRDEEGEQLLRTALERAPAEGQSALRHALGLALVRLGNVPAAIEELAAAARAADAQPRYVLTYALALDSQGERAAAAQVLETALENFGDDQSLAGALAKIYQQNASDKAASSPPD